MASSVDHDLPAPTAAIITEVRLPRVLLAALVGAVLATAGGAYQATFRNPLADPYLLGVAAGAGLGATLALTDDRPRPRRRPASLITLAAFVGALARRRLAYAPRRRRRPAAPTPR